MKKIFCLIVLSLIMAMNLGAAIINVPSDYSTIQAAINAANAGDVINVSSGTYNGNISINKNISLIGAGAEATIIDGNNSGGGTGTIRLTTGRNGVIIEGFHVKGIDGPPGIEYSAIYLQGTQYNITIKNNIIEARGDAALMGEYNAVNENIIIDNNIINGQTFTGTMPATGDQFTVPNVARQAIVFGGGSSTTNTKNFTFTNNTISTVSGATSGYTSRGNTIVTLDLVGVNTITGNILNGTTNSTSYGLRLRGTGNHYIQHNKFIGTYSKAIYRAGSQINAEQNYWNTMTQSSISSKIYGNVDFNPWCNENFTWCNYPTEPPVTNITQGTYFSEIQTAINAANAGDVIKVASGTFAENLIVDKSIDLRGANYGINPNTASRLAESIIVPATAAISSGEIIHITSSYVSVNGFTIDGDNTALTSGFSSTNGADIDAAEGVTVYETNINDLKVYNNIFKNLSFYGVTLYDYPAGLPSSGHDISYNKFQDFGTYDATSGINNWGGGVLIYNNQYARITYNVMTNVRVGVQTGNFFKPNPNSDNQYEFIGYNTIEARRRGIFHNLFYGTASSYTLYENTITAKSDVHETDFWDGIFFCSQSVNSTAGFNIIDGSGLSIPTYGYQIWNVKYDVPVIISGGSVSNVSIGVFANNWEGYGPSNAGDGAHAKIFYMNITPLSTGTGIKIKDNPSSTTHADVILGIGTDVVVTGGTTGLDISGQNAKIYNTLGELALVNQTGNFIQLSDNNRDLDATYTKFNGKKGSEMTIAELGAVEAKLYHKVDNPALGLITFNSTVNTASVDLSYNYLTDTWYDNNSNNDNATKPYGETAATQASDFNSQLSLTFDGTGILSIPFNTSSGRVNNNSDKSLFAFFETGSNIMSRQVIFEAGGTYSGFNIYVYNNKLYMGIWNSTQRRYFYQSCSANTKYFVSVERNGTSIRVSVNGFVATTTAAFNGFTNETNGINGIAGSNKGTRYMDNVASTTIITNRFNGKIAEILCYNSSDYTLRHNVIEYIDAKYGTNYGTTYTGKTFADAGLESYIWNEGDMDIDELGLKVKSEANTIDIQYNTIEVLSGKLDLYDINGSQIESIYNGLFDKGVNNFLMKTNNLSAGVYFIKLETNNSIESKKVMIVK